MIPDEAVQAAARIGEHHAGVFQSGRCVEHYHEDSFECVARLMLEAALPHLASAAKQPQRTSPTDWPDVPRLP